MSEIYKHYHAALFRQPTAEEVERVSDAVKETYPEDMLIVRGPELIAYLYHAVQLNGDAIWLHMPGDGPAMHLYREVE